jgi:hypothetical protein
MLNMRTIRERLHRVPFKPFEMRLTDGRRVPIQHPDFVALGGSVVVTDETDGVQEVDALHVSRSSHFQNPKNGTANTDLNL